MKEGNEIIDLPKINIFNKDLEIGMIYRYIDINGDTQELEVVDIDENDKTLATVIKL